MRTGISLHVTANDRERLRAIVDDRDSPQRHVWCARIVLLTADGYGTPRPAGTSKNPWCRRGLT